MSYTTVKMNEFKDFLRNRVIINTPQEIKSEKVIFTETKKRVRWHWISDNVIQKDKKSLKFRANCKSLYLSNVKRLISYDMLYKLINPLNMEGDADIYYINANKEISLIVSFSSPKIYIELDIVRDSNKLWTIDIIYIDISTDLLKHGFFRDIFTTALPIWDKLKISLITTDVTGGYYANTCSKLGFDFSSELELNRVRRKFSKYLITKNITLRSKMMHSWDIAYASSSNYDGNYQKNIGKEFLIEYTKKINRTTKETNQWLGVLDLESCSPSRLQLERYIHSKVLPKSVKCLQSKKEKNLYKFMTPERQLHMMVRHAVIQHICTGNGFLKKEMVPEAEEQYKIAHQNIKKLRRQRKWKDPGLNQYLEIEVKNALKGIPEKYLN